MALEEAAWSAWLTPQQIADLTEPLSGRSRRNVDVGSAEFSRDA
jgi:hypothetical protein